MLTNTLLSILGWISAMFNLSTVQALEFVHNAQLLSGAESLAGQIRDFIAPLALVACGIFALVFLVQRQFMQMLIFIIIAVVVFAIFFVPQMLANLGQSLGSSNENLSWD